DGVEKIASIMKEMRENGASLFEGVDKVNDYSQGLDGLPKADVLKFIFKDSSWIAIRPSGTEPKIKVYYSVRGDNKDDASKILEERRKIINNLIEN
ncbi:MAG: phospho-sugar mutase, partial [Clostridia bacterium]|nr:phospho-sugar mutase [Clostridia bacterium]